MKFSHASRTTTALFLKGLTINSDFPQNPIKKPFVICESHVFGYTILQFEWGLCASVHMRKIIYCHSNMKCSEYHSFVPYIFIFSITTERAIFFLIFWRTTKKKYKTKEETPEIFICICSLKGSPTHSLWLSYIHCSIAMQFCSCLWAVWRTCRLHYLLKLRSESCRQLTK